MAQIKQNVMGTFTGKVGTISTYNSNVGNIARIRTNATNVGEGASRTAKQQNNRVRWANMVNFYKASKNWMPKAFESKKKGLSDYNRFMSVNFGNASVALTKQQAAAGACVVEGFLISQGSLAPVQIQKHGSHWDTSIALGTLQINANTTVAELSAAMVANNNFIREGMQLSCISYQQSVDDLGTPRVICTAYELIIDSNNTAEKAYSYLPEFCLASEDGLLVTSDHISIGGFAFVLSETVSGRTLVSTQTLIVNNEVLLAEFCSNAQYAAAIESYGLNSNVFLDSNYADDKSATAQPVFVSALYNKDGVLLSPMVGGHSVGYTFDTALQKSSSVRMSVKLNSVDVTAVKVELRDVTDLKDCDIVSVSGSDIQVKAKAAWVSDNQAVIRAIHVTYKGTEYVYSMYVSSGSTEIE